MKRSVQFQYLLIILFTLISCTQKGNPTPRDILKVNPEADIFLFEGIVYSNASNLNWVTEQDMIKGELVGEIQKVSTMIFRNFTASKLPVGTEIYLSDDSYGGILIVKFENKEIRYLGLYEG